MNSDTPSTPALSDRVKSLRLAGRPSGGGRSQGSWLPWIVSFVLLLTTAAFGYRAYRVGPVADAELAARAPRTDDKPASPSSAATPTTSVAATGEVVLQSKGYVIPISLVQVSPKVGGQIVRLAKVGDREFTEGDKFDAGTVLASVERVDYEADYKQAEFAHKAATERYEELKKTLPEEVNSAEADLEEARSNAMQLKLEMDRNRRLSASSSVAQKDMEQAKYSYESTVARIKKLEANLRVAKESRLTMRLRAAEWEMRQADAMLTKSKWRLDNTEVVAPISGTILTKKAELGNIVNPSAFSSGISASLCEMADLTKLEIDLSVQERDIANVKAGQKCLIMPEAYKDDKEFLARHPRGYKGQVSRLMPTADRAKGAVPVRVKVLPGEISSEEAGRYLRPDLSATVSFLSDAAKK